jgi:hypothetical protein
MKTFFYFIVLIFLFSCSKNEDQQATTKENVVSKEEVVESTEINTIQTVIDDSFLPHEGKLKGVPDHYAWAFVPTTGPSFPDEKYNAFTAWGQLYEDASGNPATNTRVQIKNIESWYLSKSDKTWHLIQNMQGIGGANYAEDFANNLNKPADIRLEEDGGISVTAGSGYNFHFWPQNRVTIFPNDVRAMYVTFIGRLIVDDTTKPDDRDNAKYLLGAGGDYWTSLDAQWDNFKTNTDSGIGRMKYVKKEWRAFNICAQMSEEDFKNFPPPVNRINH